MSTEDQLILEIERRGLGIDINHLRGTVTIEFADGKRDRVFNSLETALRFLQNSVKI